MEGEPKVATVVVVKEGQNKVWLEIGLRVRVPYLSSCANLLELYATWRLGRMTWKRATVRLRP